MTPEEDCLAAELAHTIAGRPLSIVGNAASIFSGHSGGDIDRGCVLRMNAGIPVDLHAQGRRVDIHCFNTGPNLTKNLRNAAWHRQAWIRKRYFRGALSIWMSDEKRERCSDPSQIFYPMTMWCRLAARLGAKPSVGAMTLDMIASLTPDAEARIFGFDFKQSSTYYRKRENRGPHDWDAERRFALALAEEYGWMIAGTEPGQL